MPSEDKSKTVVYNVATRIPRGKIVTGSAVTNGAGVARFYWTDDGTSTGNPLLNSVLTWSTDVIAGVQVNSRVSATGINYVEATVTNLAFAGIVLLGISVLGSVTVSAVAGVTVMFTIIGT